jgi:hypothetical protein
VQIANAYLRDTFGIDNIPLDAAQRMKVFRLLSVVAGADQFVEAEKSYGFGVVQAVGGTQAELDELNKFDPSKEVLGDHFTDELAPLGRIILYQAIKVARSDGEYSSEERAWAKKMAGLLEIDPITLVQIESLVDAEEALRNLRKSLVMPRR